MRHGEMTPHATACFLDSRLRAAKGGLEHESREPRETLPPGILNCADWLCALLSIDPILAHAQRTVGSQLFNALQCRAVDFDSTIETGNNQCSDPFCA